jgi:hypothetical protein
MFGNGTSDRRSINAGWLTFATQLAESFGPANPALHPRETRVFWRAGWLQRLLAWGTRPLAAGPYSAADAATRLEISALGVVRH